MLIALVGRAYTGKTAIATELASRGWTILSFTDHLKALAAFTINSVRGGDLNQLLTVDDILADKPRYRRFIQEFGSLIGYESDPEWIEAFLEDELSMVGPVGSTDLVIDCLRSSAQIEGARKFGAKIIGVWSYWSDRAVFAGGEELVSAADSHPIDGKLQVKELGCDHILLNGQDRTVAKMVDDLLNQIKPVEAL